MNQNGMNMVHSLFTTVCGLSDSFIAQKRGTGIPKRGNGSPSGRNGTKIVLPLNDALNGPKCDEYGAFSLHNSLWTIRLFHRTKKRNRNPKEGKRKPKWKKRYKDSATFK